jgi:hypothetical protein
MAFAKELIAVVGISTSATSLQRGSENRKGYISPVFFWTEFAGAAVISLLS